MSANAFTGTSCSYLHLVRTAFSWNIGVQVTVRWFMSLTCRALPLDRFHERIPTAVRYSVVLRVRTDASPQASGAAYPSRRWLGRFGFQSAVFVRSASCRGVGFGNNCCC